MTVYRVAASVESVVDALTAGTAVDLVEGRLEEAGAQIPFGAEVTVGPADGSDKPVEMMRDPQWIPAGYVRTAFDLLDRFLGDRTTLGKGPDGAWVLMQPLDVKTLSDEELALVASRGVYHVAPESKDALSEFVRARP